MPKHEPSPWPFPDWPTAYAARDAARAIRAAAEPTGSWPSMTNDRQLPEPSTWTAPEPAAAARSTIVDYSRPAPDGFRIEAPGIVRAILPDLPDTDDGPNA